MNRPLRPKRALLLFTQTYATGGIQRCNQTFLRALATLGVDCDVLTLLEPPSAPGAAAPGLKVRGFSGRRLSFAMAALWAIATRRYDLVLIGHINFAMLAAVMRMMCLRHAPRMMLLAHGIEVWTGLNAMHGLALRAVDDILCVSAYTRDRIQRQLPRLPASSLRIHHNALHPDWVARHADPVDGTASVRQGLPSRFLLSVSRLDAGERYKGIITTLEVFATLDDPTLHYVVAGSGNDVEFLRNVARRLDVADRVHFLNRVSDADLVMLYRDCAAFVLPSGKEGFGIVFLEAMFHGAPVIAARAGGAVDAVDDGRTGLLSDFGDSVGLYRNIEAVLGDAALRDRLRTQAFAVVTQSGTFTFEAFTARLGRLLEEETLVG